MDLMLSLESSSAIAWSGISNTKIGTLKPGVSIDIPLCLIALHSGIVVSMSIMFVHIMYININTLLNFIML